MLDYKQRMHRAVLDEFVPEWRTIIQPEGKLFVTYWMRRTGQNQAQGYRWWNHALEILDSEQLLAA